MPAYDISFLCKHCGVDHLALLRLHIEEGPELKQSVAEYFHGRALPPQVEAIRGHSALCPKTGKKFPLESDSEIFLVPPGQFRRDPLLH